MAVDLKLAKTRLETRRRELEAQSAETGEARQAVELDQQSVGRLSRMDAMQTQAMAQAQERKRQHDLVRIEMAMRRIEAGDYGYCAECDAEIPDGRLAIDPMAEKCVGCA
ncbi:MAG: TraR/DksA C4-type zinc finger protein [Nitratireductor sp.]|nr:TraR/DksA C4-type zinc finger protein [Nitratireductor sp.]